MLRADWRTLWLCRVQIGVPSGVSYTWGRESKASYNESAAGSQNAAATGYPYGIEYINPFDAAGDLLPLLRGGGPVTPYRSADRAIQAYNFRLCVTNNATIRAPFTKPLIRSRAVGAAPAVLARLAQLNQSAQGRTGRDGLCMGLMIDVWLQDPAPAPSRGLCCARHPSRSILP